jgi:heterodisulfide reductase subunit A-like polyferredoxin
VEEAEIVRVDGCGGEVRGSERRFGVDVVALAVGLLPQTELARQARCELHYNAKLGGFIPKRSEDMQTSVPGIYVAGDLGGIEEATIAIEEGRLAGLSAAESLGYSLKNIEHQKAEIKARLKELRYVGEKKSMRLAASATGTIAECCPGQSDKTMSHNTAKNGGPQILIECPEEIPCNPCEEVCPRGAIEVGSPITNLPRLRENHCTGCGLCIAACPAQAIFLIDRSFSKDYARLDLPYEELPRPRRQQRVGLLDRQGKKIGTGKVIRTRLTQAYDKTAVVSVTAPQQIAHSIRYIDCRK